VFNWIEAILEAKKDEIDRILGKKISRTSNLFSFVITRGQMLSIINPIGGEKHHDYIILKKL
jgi:hypothetical protein